MEDKGKTILLVEDESFAREYITRAIERKKYKVIGAAGGYEAIDLYQQHKPQCVILDIKLPDIDGKEVLKKLKQIDPQANVYFLSGSEEIVSLAHAKSLGAAGYLTKPVILDDLMEII